MTEQQKEFLDSYEQKKKQQILNNGIDYTIDKLIEFHKKIVELEKQNTIMREALEFCYRMSNDLDGGMVIELKAEEALEKCEEKYDN